jgi:hypothetical protein
MLFMERKVENYAQKVSFPILMNLYILKFKFIADIDERSPSEDDEAAQRALCGEEGGELRSEGSVFIFNKNLCSKL